MLKSEVCQTNYLMNMKNHSAKRVVFVLGVLLSLGMFFACSSDDENDNEYGNRPLVPKAVDLGLPSGTKWAPCNVGASSPDYYAWGETETKRSYDWINYAPGGSELTSEKACGTSVDLICKNCGGSKAEIAGTQYDVAHVKWGGNWKMPTGKQLEELAFNCTWTWTTLNNVRGYKVVGPNGNSIFLPAAGLGPNGLYSGSEGNYWLSSLCSSTEAYLFTFDDPAGIPAFAGPIGHSYYRFFGHSVRPVTK